MNARRSVAMMLCLLIMLTARQVAAEMVPSDASPTCTVPASTTTGTWPFTKSGSSEPLNVPYMTRGPKWRRAQELYDDGSDLDDRGCRTQLLKPGRNESVGQPDPGDL